MYGIVKQCKGNIWIYSELGRGTTFKIYFPLLVTDIVMPDMEGPRIADIVKALHPEIRILYMSGYTTNGAIRHRALDPGAAFLSKPLTADELALKVREVLGRQWKRCGSNESAVVGMKTRSG